MTDRLPSPPPAGPPDPRGERGARKRAETRLRLLRAAFDLLGRPEGRHTQIDDVIRHAGVARGTFYNYFDSRDHLLDVMAYELNHGMDEAVALAPDPATRTSWALRLYIRKAQRDPQWGWAMVNVGAGGQQVFGQDTFRNATETLRDGIAGGLLRLSSLQAALDLVTGAGLQAIRTVCEGQAGPSHAEDVTQAVLLGLGLHRSRVQRLITSPLPENAVAIAGNLTRTDGGARPADGRG
ncbi:TetR/AcrR family transcriptional regulator [Streptomyces cinereospinus]|uniref:TetR/AcrR family transcriptional regulator n=1 Tax=Streptomyces cinereospinus TaxID=285561 RepID=A0ABV5MZW5_9ACTN